MAKARSRGTALVAATLALLVALGMFLVLEIAAGPGSAERERVTARALAAAREALIAYAADRPISAAVGPGYLPCPDTDNDGWAESTCGSQSGDIGQAERLGRLPWKTLGLDDLRDGHGERLWYAVSSKHKGLLNCAASRACVDMSPDAALGTITVRDNSGTLLHDGTIAEPYRAFEGGAVAVILAPGPPLARAAPGGGGAEQSRSCAPGDCDALGRCVAEPPRRAATCDPANYLDRAPEARYAFEDNSDFHDRNDAAGRPGNGNGFIQGPIALADGRLAVNDRDVMPRVMQRVALEAMQCLRAEAAEPARGGRFPWPAPPCAQARSDATAWQGQPGVLFGRIAAQPFASASCAIDASASPSWWATWRPFVFYAMAREFAPDFAGASACGEASACLELAEPGGRVIARDKHLAVLVAGTVISRDGFVQDRSGAGVARVREWLEDGNARLEGRAGCPEAPTAFPCDDIGACTRITTTAQSRGFNDVVVAIP
jgi:hypothetical protein